MKVNMDIDNAKIYGIGVDIVEVKRITNSLKKYKGFLKKIYTPLEIAYCENKKNLSAKYICFAQRFAAKEAVAKALGTGLGKDVFFNEIEIRNNEKGRPEIRFYKKSESFCKANGIKEVQISLSGTKEYAIALAMAHKYW